jgi:hypothetical protein
MARSIKGVAELVGIVCEDKRENNKGWERK